MADRRPGRAGSIFLIALGCALAAQANTYTFQVTGADAIITVSPDKIVVTLNDLYVNPTNVGQDLSGFSFTTSGTVTGTPGISSSAANAIDISGTGTYTSGGIGIAPGWGFSEASAVTTLQDLGFAGPAHTIVGAPNGSNVYAAGNGSIDGNGPHSDFLQESATWTLAETGITSATTISSVTFQFGTSDSDTVTTDQGTQVVTPEPASAGLFILGGVSLLLMARKTLLRSR